MVERHHAQRALAVTILVLCHVGQCGHTFGPVPTRHTLRGAGSAGGVEHQRQILRSGLRHRHRLAAKAIGIRDACSFTFTNKDQGRWPGLHGFAHRYGTDLFIHQHARARVLQAVRDFLRFSAPVQWRHDDACELTGPMQRGRLHAVLQH